MERPQKHSPPPKVRSLRLSKSLYRLPKFLEENFRRRPRLDRRIDRPIFAKSSIVSHFTPHEVEFTGNISRALSSYFPPTRSVMFDNQQLLLDHIQEFAEKLGACRMRTKLADQLS